MVPALQPAQDRRGLLDAATFGASERAQAMAASWANWWLAVSRSFFDDAFEAMLTTEFGGMADALARLAEVTGRTEYLAEAHRFAHREVLDPLADGRDVLDWLHAPRRPTRAVTTRATLAPSGRGVTLAPHGGGASGRVLRFAARVAMRGLGRLGAKRLLEVAHRAPRASTPAGPFFGHRSSCPPQRVRSQSAMSPQEDQSWPSSAAGRNRRRGGICPGQQPKPSLPSKVHQRPLPGRPQPGVSASSSAPLNH